MKPVRAGVEDLLERAIAANIRRLSYRGPRPPMLGRTARRAAQREGNQGSVGEVGIEGNCFKVYDEHPFKKEWLDMNTVVSGENSVGWWGFKDNAAVGSLTQLVEDWGLQARYYQGEALLVVVPPAAGQATRPTAFDGMLFPEWTRSEATTSVGITSGGKKEVVVPPGPLANCQVHTLADPPK